MSHASLLRSNQQVERHLYLAREVAVRYSRRTGHDKDDLRQVGLLGLIKASRSYRPQMKVPFEVYARPHIRGEILHYLRDGVALVRLPRRVEEEALRLSRLEVCPQNPREQMILAQYRNKATWQQIDTVADTNFVDQRMDLDQRESRNRIRKSLKALPVSERLAGLARFAPVRDWFSAQLCAKVCAYRPPVVRHHLGGHHFQPVFFIISQTSMRSITLVLLKNRRHVQKVYPTAFYH